MSEDLQKEILEELKKINKKLDEPKGLSTPMKFVALILGFLVIGPLLAYILSLLFNLR